MTVAEHAIVAAEGPSPRQSAEVSLAEKIVDRTARCGVVGLGFIGSMLAESLSRAGFAVSAYDCDAAVAARAASSLRGVDIGGPEALGEPDIVVVAVRVDLDKGDLRIEPLERVKRLPGLASAKPRLIVVSSTVPVGTTRRLAERWRNYEATFVAHAPERLQVGDTVDSVRAIPHLVGGIDSAATRLGALVIGALCDEPVPVASPEVSELAKLLENSFRAVGIAVVSELTQVAHAAGVEGAAVTAAAATKPFGYFPFHPGPGVGGHCIRNDLRLLQQSAASLRIATPLLNAAEAVLDEMPRFAVRRLARLLEPLGMALAGADVLLVGTGFKVGSADQTATPAADIVRELRRHGARPHFLDSNNDLFVVDGAALPKVDARELSRATFAAALVLSGDRSTSAADLARAAPTVLDLGGGRTLRGGSGDLRTL